MLSGTRAGRGFTLIELVVSVAIVGVLLAAAAPSFGTWMANSRVRTTAESIQNGLMLAKAEAVRRNARVQVVVTSSAPTVANINVITPATGGTGWLVRVYRAGGTYTAADFIQGRSSAEGGTNVTVAAGQSNFIFFGYRAPVADPGRERQHQCQRDRCRPSAAHYGSAGQRDSHVRSSTEHCKLNHGVLNGRTNT